MNTKKRFFFMSCTIGLISCSHMNGTYRGNGQSHFDKIVFRSEDKVELVFLGSIVETDYQREGNRVKIYTAMGTQVLSIDENGCLDGGFVMGKYCKE